VFLFVDIVDDWTDGSPLQHLAMEGLLSLLAGLAAIWLNFRLSSVRKRLVESQGQAQRFQEDAQRWKAESAKYLEGLSAAIDAQMDRWGLSEAEKQVALLLLKGLSLKEIAQIRSVSEGTIRQQATAIYDKSGTGGRAELSAFFLEDLLQPKDAAGDFP